MSSDVSSLRSEATDYRPACLLMDLPSSVVDLSEEISVIVFSSLAVLPQPKTQNKVVSNEQNSEKTNIINTEPFACSLSRQGSRGGEDGRYNSSSNGGDGLERVRLSREGCLDDGT